MGSDLTAALRRSVIERAQGKCEYCTLHQDFSIYTYEIDHTIATKHGGKAVLENTCSLFRLLSPSTILHPYAN